jgi:lipopolysaccharide transport system permease protein
VADAPVRSSDTVTPNQEETVEMMKAAIAGQPRPKRPIGAKPVEPSPGVTPASVNDSVAASATKPTEPEPDPAVDLPLTVVEPRPGWQLINFREIWKSRELLWLLTKREVIVRYKQTALGMLWAVVAPLTTMLAFAAFIGRVPGVAGTDVPYPLFVFSGLLAWSFLSSATNNATNSVVAQGSLVTKIYFPRLILPMSAIGVGLVDLAISSGFLFVLMLLYGFVPGPGALLAFPIVALIGVLAFGIGTFFSALVVKYRDFRLLMGHAMQLWMFATPCIYLDAQKIAGPRTLALLPLNPAYGLVLNFRNAILGLPLDLPSLGISALMAAVFVVIGCFWFRRLERQFADVM